MYLFWKLVQWEEDQRIHHAVFSSIADHKQFLISLNWINLISSDRMLTTTSILVQLYMGGNTVFEALGILGIKKLKWTTNGFQRGAQIVIIPSSMKQSRFLWFYLVWMWWTETLLVDQDWVSPWFKRILQTLEKRIYGYDENFALNLPSNK